MSSHQTKDIIIVELNEFNEDLLKTAVQQHELPALAKIINMPRTQYRTNDRYNSGYLEPWVQWVSIHAATASTFHQVKHLGDVPDLQFEQCWETLSRHHVTSGVWGVMNGSRNQAKEVKFFVPDPWTFSETAYPQKLNHIISLPRYVAKNYQSMNKLLLAKKGIELVWFLFTSGITQSIFKALGQLRKDLKTYGNHHFIFITFFEYLATLLFIKNKKATKTQCSILFLNSLAHIQHHYWSQGEAELTPELIYGFKMIDKMMAALLEAFPEDGMIVHNGLSQMNTNHEKPWILYRQKNPMAFLKALGIPASRVEQHMTHDGHVFFKSIEECEQTYEHLKAARIADKPIFHVEKNAYDPCKLYYHLAFTDEVQDSNLMFEFNQQQYRFLEHFDIIVKRTGRHIPIGTVYSDTIRFKDHIQNHDFNRYVFNYFKPEEFELNEKSDRLFNIQIEPELEDELA